VSLWRNFLTRVKAQTKVGRQFTEHDLRTKSMGHVETLKHAQKPLTHAEAKITKKVYRRTPELVEPAG
jgi:integrase